MRKEDVENSGDSEVMVEIRGVTTPLGSSGERASKQS